MAPPIDIDVQPASIQFGEVRVGTVLGREYDRGAQPRRSDACTSSSVTLPAGFGLIGPAAFEWSRPVPRRTSS